MKRAQRFVIVAIVAMLAVVYAASAAPKGKGKGKHEHHNGKQLLGEKIKTNGHHVIQKKGDVTTSVEVKDGKVAGVHVKHATKGDLPVKKYKTTKKMAQREVIGQADGIRYAALLQGQYLGTMYIGYAYIDEYGDEEIYWFPYDIILDGDTGAVEYLPAY